MYATKRYPPIIPKVSNIAWVLLNPIMSKGRLKNKYRKYGNFHIEKKVSCEPLIQTEIDSSVTPNSALFSW